MKKGTWNAFSSNSVGTASFIQTVGLVIIMTVGVLLASNAVASDAALCDRYFGYYERKYNMPVNLLKAVSITESGRWIKGEEVGTPWPWTLNVRGKGYHFDSKREAISKVRDLQHTGENMIDVGCMQINLRYHPEAFDNIYQALEPRYNIAYAAHFLYQNYKRTGNWQSAISRYHSANAAQGKEYYARILSNWKAANLKDGLDATQPLSGKALVVAHNDEDVQVMDITRSALERFGYTLKD